MISEEERRYLHWLGRTQWTGAGHVVEMGPWLGGSTVCLAAGMRRAGPDPTGRLHTFDNFVWRDFMADQAPIDLAPGTSFLDRFRRYIAPYRDIVRAHVAALPDEEIRGDDLAASYRTPESWKGDLFAWEEGEPIEILFIDGAKSWSGMRCLLRTVAKSLLPGRTLLVCQDFKHWESYWVPLILARLTDHVAPVHDVVKGSTVTFRLEKPLDEDAIDRVEADVGLLDRDAALADLRGSAELLAVAGDPQGAGAVALCQVNLLSHLGDADAAIACFRQMESSWPLRCDTLQLEWARRYLESEKGCALPPRRLLRMVNRARRFVRSPLRSLRAIPGCGRRRGASS